MWIKTKWTLVPAHRLQLALVRGSVAFSRLHVMYLDYHVATRRQNYRLFDPEEQIALQDLSDIPNSEVKSFYPYPIAVL